MAEGIKNFTISLIKNQLNLKPRFCNSTNLCGLSNHHPMMMYSLYYIGASQERITQASELYLNTIPKKITKEIDEFPIQEISQDNFKQNLGRDDQYFNFYDYFLKEQNKFEDNQKFLSHYLNVIPSFLYSEAFHCLIRLGFFQDMGLSETHPQILSQIATAHFDMVQCDQQKPPHTISDIIQKVLEKREYFEKIELSGIIVDRMKIINSDNVFADILSHPIQYEGQKTLNELLDILLKIFWISDNFTMMHALNSLLSFQKIVHLMNCEKQSFQTYFTGLVCAFITTFRVYNYSNILEDMGKIEILKDLPSFEEIFQKVALSDDDHEAKTVYALHQQFLLNPSNRLLQQKAAKIAKLI